MAATSSAKKEERGVGRKNGIGGFVIDKLDQKLMMKYIVDNDIAEAMGGVDEEMSTEQIGVALAMHFKNTTATKNQARCTNCLAISDGSQGDCCPFCGDDAEEEAATTTAGGDSEPKDDEDEAHVPDDDEGALEEEEEEDGDIPETGEVKKPTAQAAAAPASGTKKTTKKGSTTMVATTTANGASKKNGKGSTALAKKGAVGSPLAARDLDKARDEVIEIKSRGARDYWEMGKKLAEINKKQLWKLRVNEETGKNQHNGFDAFVIAELQMTPMSAYRAIGIAENYTQDQAFALGKTKASLILQAAPEDRKKLEAAAKKGASKRTIEKGVKASRAKKGPTKKSQQAKAGAKGGAKKATVTAARSEKISITSIEGSKTIKLHKKPESFKDVVFSKLPRAAKIGDKPIGRFEMANGLVQYYEVRLTEEGWTLKIETRREAAE